VAPARLLSQKPATIIAASAIVVVITGLHKARLPYIRQYRSSKKSGLRKNLSHSEIGRAIRRLKKKSPATAPGFFDEYFS